MAAHPFLRFWQAPGFAGRFFCSALCKLGILGFSTQQPALFGENAVENV